MPWHWICIQYQQIPTVQVLEMVLGRGKIGLEHLDVLFNYFVKLVAFCFPSVDSRKVDWHVKHMKYEHHFYCTAQQGERDLI